ncbi:REP-associated tyrosine transposase [Anabaena subtropica]|uniref:Transposase n=1 Tax=Anabaena subtropica FACHB-260 TaxID=2692884 RepID=A0ABR8CTI5_9NOST|nr:transposase [Anabaena subtropica]MBD2345800.1 transposase [Anabaena subtropica FACHB-260]
MPEYRRAYLSGGTFFLTLVTYERYPIFSNIENVCHLRSALAKVRSEMPFEIEGAVVLPDHIHFLWTLPTDDENYSQRIGRLKVLFTRSLGSKTILPENLSNSRRKHRESNVWQRRFWEHTIRDEADFEKHLNYIHYNPVKHGLVSCPHLWDYSSFHKFVRKGIYSSNWYCSCSGKRIQIPDFDKNWEKIGE